MSKVLERLAKLMELSSSDNENEAALAAQRAAELMAREQLTIADVTAYVVGQSKIDVEQGRIDDEDKAPMSRRCELWHQYLAVAVVEAFGGRMWRNHYKKAYMFVMIGPPSSVSAARYVYMMLEREVGRLSRSEMKKREESNSWRRAYARGMAIRIGERLKAGRANVMGTADEKALVFVGAQQKAVEDAYNEKQLTPGRATGKTKSVGALAEGYVDGGNVDLPTDNARGLTAAKKELT